MYHRQFLLDRIAKEGKYGNDDVELNSDFRWELQNWKPEYKELKGFISNRHISNGIPTRTRIAGRDEGTYFQAAKERLSSAPGFTATSKDKEKTFPVRGPYLGKAFISPLFSDDGDFFDEDKMTDEVLKALKYSPAEIADIKNKMQNAKAATEAFEELAKFMPEIEVGLDIDLTSFIPDELLDRGRDYVDEKLTDYVGCEDD